MPLHPWASCGSASYWQVKPEGPEPATGRGDIMTVMGIHTEEGKAKERLGIEDLTFTHIASQNLIR